MKSNLLLGPAALVLMLVFSSIGAFAQVDGVESGSIYVLSPQASTRVLNSSNSSLQSEANVDVWTNTDSDAQRWLISHLDGTTYTIQNVGTGKFLHYAHSNPSSGINVNQYDGIDHITLKWSISNNGDGTFTFSPAANNALAMSVDAGFDEDGLNVLLHDKDELPAQLWTLEPVSPLDPAPTDAIADEVFEAWKTKYYYTDANGGHIRNEGFWGVAEMMEIVLDAYETSGKAKYINMFDEMYEGFLADEGTNWLWNDFNDDIMWITIACSRAYLFTGDQKYLYKAAYHFDQVYNRAWTDAYGGGLEWKEGLTTKNSCINGPAIVAACYLLQATDNQRYLTTAERIYEWQRRMLYDQNSGAVWDSYDGPGNINYWSSTYNQGTFLGAAVMLYNLTGDQMYYEDAVKIANYTRHNMYNNGVINWESGRDLEGFKGIFVRYARRYVVDFNKDNYIDWFQKNAQVAYNNRNSEGIISTLWGTRTKEDVDYNAFDASTAVSLMVNCPVETEVLKDAYNIIEAEDFNYLKGIVTEPCLEGTDYVGEILDGDYTGYNHVFFGNQSLTGAEFRVSNGSANDGTIEIRLDGPGGAVIGTATVAPTSDWTEYTTVTCDVENVNGFRNVYLVFKGDGDIARINHFKFLSEGTEGNLNGNFAIRNRNSGLIMEIADDGNEANGENVQQGSVTGNDEQRFILEEVAEGVYSIINVKTGKAVEIENSDEGNFANAQQWEYFGNDNQLFKIEPTDNGYYTIKALHSEKILEVGFARLNAGANINQYDNNGQTCGQWELVSGEITSSGGSPDFSEGNSLTVYPNPVSDMLYVKGAANDAVMEVFTLSGKKVKATDGSQLDVSDLDAGVYVVKISLHGTVEQELFVKE